MAPGTTSQPGTSLRDEGTVAQRRSPAPPGLRPGETRSFEGWSATRLREFKSCQRWLKSDIGARLGRLIPTWTGLSFCIVWNGPFTSAQDTIGNRFCPRSKLLGPGSAARLAHCANCRRRHWERSAITHTNRHRFRGLCGAPTLWVNLRVGDTDLGRVVFQTAPRALATGRGAPDFGRALDLLGLVLAQTGAQLRNRRLREELAAARRLLRHLETELDRLRHELHARRPELPQETAPPGTADHTKQIVDQMLAYVHEHYRKPMSLGQLAQALGRNASHLSTLFSHTTGVPFHAYVDELRLAKAKELLRDFTRPIAQVACETGYASEDWFRHAFKAHTGLSPSAWREIGLSTGRRRTA